MTELFNYVSASSSPTLKTSSTYQDTENDHIIAKILAEEENNLPTDGNLGARLYKLGSIPHTPRVIYQIPDFNDAMLDHERLAARLATYGLSEHRMEGDGNCQFRALSDQLFHNPEDHKHVRKQVIKQLKRFRKLYEGYVPMKYKCYLKKMKRSGEWGDHVTLQAAADRFGVKICLVTSFRDTCYIEILPKNIHHPSSRELWLSFWSEVHYNSLYTRGDIPVKAPKKKHWLF
ncbi:OVARIAN TUMOR DOMAIN-containing deubiquitinating enzyme 11-like [Impatiens glandulifera]|uniref:OVARIAN TUMOR DOMAIN-containing deubiquitinating enzyme 11-like n=1 Tax=Impatiens glandulifera TaxID=253017 RepID=UPI001FB18D1C|nr:OVARIAN TUMOR DOMAIN-containing deubiquitinating enzyme 11-like [Impatiens glandulifera]